MMFYCFIISTLCVLAQTKMYKEEDLKLPIKTLIEKYGYPLEEHEVVTPDGYILTTHRIPYGRNSSNKVPNEKPVFFVHGMGGNAESVLALGTRKSLGYLLANNGYDVWLMNSRGTYYSRKHKSLKAEDPRYWQFSWHEIAIYDVAVNIDYILNVTNKNKLNYIGHSQGSTTYFVLTSEKPEFCDKIRLHISFAPPVFLHLNKHRYGKIFSKYVQQMEELVRNFNVYEGISPEMHEVLQKVCTNDGSQGCLDAIQIAQDASSRYITKETLKFALRTMPYGISIFQTLHYLQVTESGSFRRYDFGEKENLVRYGTETPPIYNVSLSRAPVVLMYTQRDWFASEKQTMYLAKLLPNVVETYKIPILDFGHIDFAIAYNAKEAAYDYVIKMLNNLS